MVEQTTSRGDRLTRAEIAIAVLAGLVVVFLLFPGSGIDPQPPVCYSVFGYTVPCDAWISWAAGAATTAIVALAFWLRRRRA